MFKNTDEDENTQSVEMKEVTVQEDEDAERDKTEEENVGKADKKQVVKEGEDKVTEGRGGAEEEGEGEEEAEDVSAVPTKKAPEEMDYCIKGGPKKLTNQFNFCERAALTCNNPCRVSFIKVICQLGTV